MEHMIGIGAIKEMWNKCLIIYSQEDWNRM